MCFASGVVDTENVNPEDMVDHGGGRKLSAVDIATPRVSADRHKLYNPNHYQDDNVSLSILSC